MTPRPQFRRRLRLSATRFRAVLHLSRQSQPGQFRRRRRVLEMDWIYGNASDLVTFLQNHDVGPDNDFRFRFKGEQWMAAAAYNLLWTIRGIPCLYYGEEIEFMKGAPQDVIGNDDTLDRPAAPISATI
jgi:glycosidase